MSSFRRSIRLRLAFGLLLAVPSLAGAQTVFNDNFSSALTIAGPSGAVSGGNSGATLEAGEPNHLGVSGGHSVWYRWKAKSNGIVAFSTATSSFDTVLAVYTGTQVFSLTFVAGNDDISSLKTSWVSFNAKAGTTYSIAVDGHGSATGNISLAWTQGGSDFDADGRSDLLIQDPVHGQVSVAFAVGSTFHNYQPPQPMPAGSQAVGAGDFNGDGMPDVALVNPFTRQLTIGFYTGQVLTSFQPLVTLPTGWRVAGIDDFNGDGQPDLLLENPSTRDVAIGYVTAMTLTKYQFVKTLPLGWQVIGVGDFSGDGQPDLVLQNPATRQISIAYVVGSVLQSYHALVTLPSGWQAVGVGDFNTDGLPDLVLLNPATRDVSFALVSPQLTVRYAAFTKLPLGWQVAGPLAHQIPVLFEDFNDNIVNAQWWKTVSVANGGSATEQNHRLEIDVPATASGLPEFLAAFQSQFKLRGDFDIQVDFNLLTWPANNGMRMGIVLSNSNNRYRATVHRISQAGTVPGGESHTATLDTGEASEIVTRVVTNATIGRFRMVRSGSTFTSYYWDSAINKWTSILVGGNSTLDINVTLQAWSSDTQFQHMAELVAFDNFIVNTGTIIP